MSYQIFMIVGLVLFYLAVVFSLMSIIYSAPRHDVFLSDAEAEECSYSKVDLNALDAASIEQLHAEEQECERD